MPTSLDFVNRNQFFMSRKLFRVQATVLRENEEKVVVEETFQPKTFTDEKKGGAGKPPDDSSSSTLERWVIKLERSTNVFLTASSISFLFFSIS